MTTPDPIPARLAALKRWQAMEQAFQQAALLLILVIGFGAKPALKNMTLAAVQVKNLHGSPSCKIKTMKKNKRHLRKMP